jgi:hypothetical protein
MGFVLVEKQECFSSPVILVHFYVLRALMESRCGATSMTNYVALSGLVTLLCFIRGVKTPRY